MAEKHKSKYKKPENSKPTYRKDLKDYTTDDKAGALNPYSTGKRQEKVARKSDKPVQDDGNMFPKYTDKDRLYKNLKNGEYDPKHAMNILRRRQDDDTDEYFDALEKIDHGVTTSELDERISKLSKKQKDQLIREYVRRKIAKFLREQGEPATEEEPEAPATPDAATPAEAPATPDAGATTTAPGATTPSPAEAPATPDATAAPALDAAAAPAPPAPAPADPASAPDDEKSSEEKEAEKIVTLKRWLEYLKTKQEKGPSTLTQTAIAPLASMIKKLSPEDAERAKKLAIRQIKNITIEAPAEDEE